MIRIYQLEDDAGDVVPQAIFWRPLRYFTTGTQRSFDDLDDYVFSRFEIGNWLRFDLRRYSGHPAFTVTLYLSLSMDDASDIRHAIDRVVREFRLPGLAVAWQRGEPFQYGNLQRPRRDRLREPEARLLALKIASEMPNHRASTETLIENMPRFIQLSDLDLRQSATRRRQPQWHQIVRNVISHRTSPVGPFELGYAVRTKDGLAVTDHGMTFLKSLGYLP